MEVACNGDKDEESVSLCVTTLIVIGEVLMISGSLSALIQSGPCCGYR